MKTWIVDWGEGTRNGSRYALFQCPGDKDDALMELDCIANVDGVDLRPLVIPDEPFENRYLEIGEIEPWFGLKVGDLFKRERDRSWLNSGDEEDIRVGIVGDRHRDSVVDDELCGSEDQRGD